jgi:hypothetical protein
MPEGCGVFEDIVREMPEGCGKRLGKGECGNSRIMTNFV